MATTKRKTAAPKKRSTSNRKAAVAKSSSTGQSFRIVSSDTPFFSFTVTKQSVYWLIFMVAVLALGAWVLYLQDKINQLYDQIDTSNYQAQLTPDQYKQLHNDTKTKQ